MNTLRDPSLPWGAVLPKKKIVQHLLTNHFGDGICVYRAEFEKPEDYTGDLEKKVAGPFDTWAEGEAYLKAQEIEEYQTL